MNDADSSPLYFATNGQFGHRPVVIRRRHAGRVLVEDLESGRTETISAGPWNPIRRGERLAAFYRANIIGDVNRLAERLENAAAELRALVKDASLRPDEVAEMAEEELARLRTMPAAPSQLAGEGAAWAATARELARLRTAQTDSR
jgi:hypothetical protein